MKEHMLLITGASGMVGSAFIRESPESEQIERKDCDFLKELALNGRFRDKYVVHLAAKVGGVGANTRYISDFYTENARLNEELLNAAHIGDTKKVISLLSTCVYPDAPYVTYPLTEDQLHMGPPHDSNYGYAYSKRMIDVMSRAYRQQYGCNFITAIPNNLYGENDNFDLENSHVIPALIRKIWEAKINNSPSVECWGDGSSLREFTYSNDIAKILLFLLENYNEKAPINIGNTEEHSIKDVVSLLCKDLEYEGEVVWNTDKPSGQHKKPSSNQKLLDLGWDRNDYTSLEKGLRKTCSWFKLVYPKVRGVN